MADMAPSMGMADRVWSIGMDWEINGPMNIISTAKRLIQLARAWAEGREEERLALRSLIGSMRMLVGIVLHRRLGEHLHLDHEITRLGEMQR